MTLSAASKTSAVLVAGLVATGMVAAPSAQAYPPGNKTEVFVKKTSIKPGKPIAAKAVSVKPGCVVTFTVRGNGVKKRSSAKANKNGIAKTNVGKAPKVKGKYQLVARGGAGANCPAFVTKTSFKVIKKANANG
jgi:hypothetical protein